MFKVYAYLADDQSTVRYKGKLIRVTTAYTATAALQRAEVLHRLLHSGPYTHAFMVDEAANKVATVTFAPPLPPTAEIGAWS